MKRDEIRRRALHAATAVSFTMGLIACGGSVLVGSGQGDDGAGGTAGGATTSTPGPTTTTTTTTTADPIDVPDAAIADAGEVCPQGEGYVACCNEHNWDWDAGCMAWGPPMPPAMRAGVA